MPVKKVREHRSLIKYRQRLVKNKTSIQNSIRAIFSGQGIAGVPKGKSAWKKEGLAWFRSYAKPLGRIKDIEQLWRGRLYVELQTFEAISKALKKVENKLGSADSRIMRLQTIPGVGPRLSETVVAFLDDPNRFKNGKHVGSYAGLTPKQYQSGQMERQGGISGQGNRLLRNLLIEISWSSVRHNRWARDTYKKLLRGSKSRKKIAITALARKLLVKCWAMLRDERDWEYDIKENAA
jgi:transposase